ncbi:MAG: alpha-hydroxy-acid oxidizing protein [Gammaproteobacteria bacterium]|nr:alpha-hydroxy-acid oxidizing protein [Gammaproteobacteria bacterium]
MRFKDTINIDDLRKAAKRHAPKIVFDFIEGGVEDEAGIGQNEQAFRDQRLVPRYAIDVSERDQTTTLFGRQYSSPFGISPTGLAALFRPGADLILARAAREANVPFIMSGASTASIEDLAKVAPDHGWYQLYAAKEKSISVDMIRRADEANLSTLVVTLDVPVHPKRERNVRNGFGRPLKLSLGTKFNALFHPQWLAGFLQNGTPMLSNWAQYAPSGSNADQVADFVSTQTAAPLSWKDLERFRELWPRKMVLKGVLHPDDAVRAADIGVDGLIVSNHGGRQFDRAPTSLEVLPTISRAVGDRMTLMLDSGVRRGVDAMIARCYGAQFVFVGRATLYGTVAGGFDGATRALSFLRDEIDTNLAQIGCPRFDDLGPEFLMWEDPNDWQRNIRDVRVP